MFTKTLLASVLGALVAALAAPAALAHDGPHAGLEPLAGRPAATRVHQGLEYTATGPCAGLYRIMFTRYCTHGPDPEPAGENLRSTAPAAAAIVPAQPVPKAQCTGDGTSGKRVQVIYARPSDAPDNYVASKPAVAAGAIDADRVFRESAAETSGTRRVRFVHDAYCNLSIVNLSLAPTALVSGNLGATITALQALGYNRADRKYLVFVDHAADPANDVNCGIGTLEKWDDQPGSANASNGGPGYARVGPSCWNVTNSTAAHELMHTLGAVQNTAPNWNGVGHCLDDTDRMCYDQFVPGFTFRPNDCVNHERLFDCNHDDYFHTNPPAGNYLDTHWNTADSDYLSSSLGDAWAFVRANDPTATSYTPADDFNQSSTNAKNTISRVGTGSYFVDFRDLGLFSAPYGVVLVTAYGGSGEHCNLSAGAFAYLTPDTIAGVICYDAAGNRVDAQFDASFIRPLGSSSGFAYLHANDQTAASYTPDTTHQFNSTGAVNTITRSSTGDYAVRLPGLASSGGTVKVTAVSPFSRFCKAEEWNASGADEIVNVLCFDFTGAPVDEEFTLAFADRTSILANGAASGYVWANDANAASYTPSSAYQFNSTGALNTVTRTGTGLYTVGLPGLGSEFGLQANRGTVHVTSQHTTSKRCEVVAWRSGIVVAGTPVPLSVDVACHTAAGTPADSKFVLQFTK